MTEDERSFAQDRANRQAARQAFDANFARLKGEVEAHSGIVGVIRHEAGNRLRAVGRQGLAVVRESKGIIAGTVATLGLWHFRKPLVDAAKSWLGKSREPDDIQEG